MPALTSEARSAAARVGALSRSRQPHDPDLVNARRDLRAARAEEYVNDVVAGWPPLTPEQVDKLVTILRREEVAK